MQCNIKKWFLHTPHRHLFNGYLTRHLHSDSILLNEDKDNNLFDFDHDRSKRINKGGLNTSKCKKCFSKLKMATSALLKYF